MTKRRSSQPTPKTPSSSPSSLTLTDLVLSHFERHQRAGGEASTDPSAGGGGVLDAPSRAARLRDDISSELLNRYVVAAASVEDGEGRSSAEEVVAAAREEIIEAVSRCVDISMEAVAAAKGAAGVAAVEESVETTLELVAAFACGRGDGTLAAAVVKIAVTMASKVQSDAIRTKACNLLGMCVTYALSGTQAEERESGGRKKKRQSKGYKRDEITSFLLGTPTMQSEGELEAWRAVVVNESGDALLPRLTDKSQAVRLSAVQAGGAFFQQNGALSESPYSDLLEALLERLAHDSSFACRSAAARTLPVTKETVPCLLERVRDVKAKVRVDALEALRSKADVMKDLSEEHRVVLLQSGLTERCPETNRATVEMLCCGWMKALKFDPVALLQLLDPVTNETICEKVIRAIVTAANDDENEVLKDLSDPEIRAYKEGFDRKFNISETDDEQAVLDPATALYVRVLCDETEVSTSLSPSEKANTLGKLLPDIPALGQTLKKHLDRLIDLIKSNEDQNDEEVSEDETEASEDAECFICSQLLKMARRSSDLQEEGSRRHFVSLMVEMLGSIDTPEDLLEGCVLALHAAHDREARFLQTVSEIVSNVGDNECMIDETEHGEDILQQVRVVSILSLALEVVATNVASSGNTAILDSLSAHIVPAVTSPSAAAREAGVGCLGRFALLAGQDRALAEIRPLLLRVCNNPEERMEVRAQAAMALCDLTLIFGDRIEQEDREEDDTELSFSFLLSEMLCLANPAMVAVAAEIVAKLLLAGRLSDPILLAHLVVAFFDTNLADAASIDDEDEECDRDSAGEVGSYVRMQQILSIFFPAFAIRSRDGRETLTACIRPLLSIVESKMTAKGGTKRGRGNGRTLSWPIAKMIEFICSAVDAGAESHEAQQAAAKAKAEELANDGDENENEDAAEPEGETTTPDAEEPSSTLLASIAITEFLSDQSATLTNTYLRALCKILSGAYIDIEIDDPKSLSCLKRNLDHLAMIIPDEPSLKNLEKLVGVLDDFEIDDEPDDAEDDSAASLAGAVQKTTLEDKEEETVSDDGGDADSSGPADDGDQTGDDLSAISGDFGSIDGQHKGVGNPAFDDEDDFFGELGGGDDDLMEILSDDDDSSYGSKENAGNRSRGKRGGGSKEDTNATPRRQSTRRRQLANVNA